jgi:hypothetical protein
MNRKQGMVNVLLLCVAFQCAAQDVPALRLDRASVPSYMNEPSVKPSASAVPPALKEAISVQVEEILAGPWAPLCSDYSAHQANARAGYEWTFIRPGDEVLALAAAAPYLSPGQQDKAKARVATIFAGSRPSSQVFVDFSHGRPRNIRKPQPQPNLWLPDDRKQKLLFWAAYAVWSGADAFALWDEAKPCFEEFKALRRNLEDELMPKYMAEADGALTAPILADPTFRLQVYESMLSGYLDHYHYWGRGEAERRMAKRADNVFMYDQSAVFFYVKWLRSLIGYCRLARHYGDLAEAQWAEGHFADIATMLLSDKSAPFLWCDDALTPEIARLLRDGAGAWLDELATTPNVGQVPAVDWSKNVVPGVVKQRVINPYTWFYAWGNHGEGVHPRTVFAAYLAHAWLLGASNEDLDTYLDIPWCQADLYHLRKLVVLAEKRACLRK